MAQAISSQHPAVVLRSHYVHLRALLAVLVVAMIGLTAAVVILATQDDADVGIATQTATPAITADPPGSIRYDGGPEEGTRGVLSAGATVAAEPGVRYDGGPEEGTRGAFGTGASAGSADGIRYDGGPEEGTRSPGPQTD